MKENFEQTLREINELAKKDKRNEGLLHHIGKSNGLKNYEVDNLFDFQEEKRMIMDELRMKLKMIDEGKAVSGFTPGEKRDVLDWNEELNCGSVTLADGEVVPATAGELLTDGVFGVSYRLGENVPRNIKKEYVVTEAKRYLMEVVGNQIEHKKYSSEVRRAEWKKPDEGFMAEKFVETYFEQLNKDFSLPIEMEEVDREEDTKHKIDFILHIPVYKNGEEFPDEKKKNIGVQFTISENASTIRNKKEEVLKAKKYTGYTVQLDDMILVQIPLKNCVEFYKKWQEEGMRPGGPTKLWSEEEKEMVFRGMLNGLVPENKINEIWEKIKRE